MLDSLVSLLALDSSVLFLVWDLSVRFPVLVQLAPSAASRCPDSVPLFPVLARPYPAQEPPFPETDLCWAEMCLASGMAAELFVPLRQRVTAVAPQSGRYSK